MSPYGDLALCGRLNAYWQKARALAEKAWVLHVGVTKGKCMYSPCRGEYTRLGDTAVLGSHLLPITNLGIVLSLHWAYVAVWWLGSLWETQCLLTEGTGAGWKSLSAARGCHQREVYIYIYVKNIYIYTYIYVLCCLWLMSQCLFWSFLPMFPQDCVTLRVLWVSDWEGYTGYTCQTAYMTKFTKKWSREHNEKKLTSAANVSSIQHKGLPGYVLHPRWSLWLIWIS